MVQEAIGTPAGKGTLPLTHPRFLQGVSILVGLAIWQVAAGQFSHFILPAPSAVALRFLDPAFAWTLLLALGRALVHMLAGFGLALAVAVPLGILLGRSPRLNAMFDPVISAFYAVPPVAFVPFLIIWFGLFFEARVALVFIMSFPDVLVVVIAGSRDVDSRLVNVGRSFGAGRLANLRLVVLPASLPFLFTALRIGTARAINGMVTAELFFAAVNLGALMKDSAERFDAASVLAVVVLIGAFGLFALTLVRALEARFLSWHPAR